MKRSFFAWILVLLVLLSAVSCGPKEPEVTTPSAGAATLEAVAALAEKNYSSVRLERTVTTQGVALPSTFTTTAGATEFSIARLSTLPLEEEDYGTLPDSFLQTVTGRATFSGDTTTVIECATEVTLPARSVLRGQLCLAAANLSNLQLTDRTLSADVLSPSSLLAGLDMATGMKIELSFTADALTGATVTYTTEKASVTLVYTFTL